PRGRRAAPQARRPTRRRARLTARRRAIADEVPRLRPQLVAFPPLPGIDGTESRVPSTCAPTPVRFDPATWSPSPHPAAPIPRTACAEARPCSPRGGTGSTGTFLLDPTATSPAPTRR